MNAVLTVARYTIQESLRRKVFVVVLLLSVGFLGLYWWGSSAAFDEVRKSFDFEQSPVRAIEVAGGTLLGLAMFAILFLGTVLAVFLTLNAIRGDAERGLLQGILVRPVSRAQVLGGRFLAAFAVTGAYVVVMFLATAFITRAGGDWSPDRWLAPTFGLVGAMAVMTAISLFGSVFLSSTANGIAVFMVFGAGLVGGLLGQIGDAINSQTLTDVSTWTTRALPFEGLYQNGLYGLTADFQGIEGVLVRLGPFGGAKEGGVGLWIWSLVYVAGLLALAAVAFRRRDL